MVGQAQWITLRFEDEGVLMVHSDSVLNFFQKVPHGPVFAVYKHFTGDQYILKTSHKDAFAVVNTTVLYIQCPLSYIYKCDVDDDDVCCETGANEC